VPAGDPLPAQAVTPEMLSQVASPATKLAGVKVKLSPDAQGQGQPGDVPEFEDALPQCT